ncbi:MAG: S-layer homology domain-containing protein [Acidimicrobiales bacterium]|nr:S-layer homology domain-containing protein [Acidimicrobiales bacterium]
MRRSQRTAVRAVVALAVFVAAVGPAGAIAGFGGVPDDRFYSDAVQWMVDNDITSGTSEGCFSPDADTTRAQLATFIHRAEGEPAGGEADFADVASNAFYADAVGWMAQNDITTGTTPNTFSPDRPVTRGEVATFLHRVAGEPPGGEENFVDVDPDDFFAAAVGWMVANGITTGTSSSTFSPHRNVTRGEVATFLYRVAGEPSVALTGDGYCDSADGQLAAAEARSFQLLNQLRTGLGLDPLTRNGAMDAAAREWSFTMDDTGNFQHSNLPYGENIAWWSAGYATPEAAAEKMHELWTNSPGHYANMTRADYELIGVGFWQSDDGGWHATHVFSF